MSAAGKTDLERFLELHESFGIKAVVEQPTERCEHITASIDALELSHGDRSKFDGCAGYGAIYSFNPDGSFVKLWTGYI